MGLIDPKVIQEEIAKLKAESESANGGAPDPTPAPSVTDIENAIVNFEEPPVENPPPAVSFPANASTPVAPAAAQPPATPPAVTLPPAPAFDYNAEMAELQGSFYQEPPKDEDGTVSNENYIKSLDANLKRQAATTRLDYEIKSFRAESKNIPGIEKLLPKVEKQVIDIFKSTGTIVKPNFIAEQIIGQNVLKNMRSAKRNTTTESFAPDQKTTRMPSNASNPSGGAKWNENMDFFDLKKAGIRLSL